MSIRETSSRCRERGFALITAIVLIVVVAVLATAIAVMSVVTKQSAADHLMSKQALFLAESGHERAANQLLAPNLNRIACAALPAAATGYAGGEFALNVQAGSPFYPTAPTLSVFLSALAPSPITALRVGSTAGLAAYGRVSIDREALDYSALGATDAQCGGAGTAPCLLGVRRARAGTAAADHAAGTPVAQYLCSIDSTGAVPTIANASARRLLRTGVQLQEGWALGNNGVLFRWNGSTWINQGSPVGSRLNAVSMLSYVDGWAVGENWNPPGPPPNREIILRWTGGPNWTLVPAVGPIPNVDLNSVHCVSRNDCWIVGDQSGGETILRWLGGPNWLRMPPIGPIPNTNLNSIYCVASNDCWIVGNQSGGEIILRWLGGPNWLRMPPIDPIPNTNLNSVHCVASNDCWIVGNQSGGETILRWTGGPNWLRMPPIGPIPNTNLNSVYCVATDDCWAVGNPSGGETILRWTGGPNWVRIPPVPAIPNRPLHSVHCTHGNDCWIVGNRAGGELLLHWDGSAWSRVPPSGLPNQHLRSVYIVGPAARAVAAWQEVYP